MNQNPVISVIVPVYNAEEFLPQLLLDIKNQTFNDFECILINDGSTDSSSEICHSISAEDCRFRVIDKENGGVSDARNRGLEESFGKFVTFVDSDDRINIHYLEFMRQAMKDDVDVVVCQRKIVFKHDCKIRGKIKNLIVKKDCSFSTYLTNNRIGFQVPTYVWGHLYRKELIKNYFKRMEEVGFEDCYFNIVNIPYFKKIAFVYRPLYCYLVRDNSLCKNKKCVERSIILSAKSLINYCNSLSGNVEQFSELAPYVFQTVSAFSSLIFMYSLYKDEQFVSDYEKLIPDMDKYYSYWKQNKYKMNWFVYRNFWGFIYKFTKRKLAS